MFFPIVFEYKNHLQYKNHLLISLFHPIPKFVLFLIFSNNFRSEEFQCKNKQCISIDNKCDGTPQCADLSDETEEACLRLVCPGHTFKCKYGACISRKGRCNGITECFDGSDESKEECGDTYVTPKNPIVTPPTPVTSSSTSSSKPRPPNVYTP